MTLIKTKRQYYNLAMQGRCGNAPRMWSSLSDYAASDYQGPVGIRFLTPGSKRFIPSINRESALRFGHDLHPGTYIVSEVPPRPCTFQGEFGFVEDYELDYSYDPCTLREAMLNGRSKRVQGWYALNLLLAQLGETQYEEIMLLMHQYTHNGIAPVIEFSKFPVALGMCPNRDTLIWEVRHY